MKVTDGYSQGVCGIIRLGDASRPSKSRHHFLNLTFVSSAISGNCLFHLRGFVVKQRSFKLCHGQQYNTACMSYTQGCTCILREKKLLNGHSIWLILLQQIG